MNEILIAATCTSTGIFEELVEFDTEDWEFLEETEEGVGQAKFKDTIVYYLDYVVVRGNII
jgi:hypothetical protein